MQFTTGIIALAAVLFSATSATPVADINAEPASAPAIVERQSAHISFTSDAEFKRIMLGGHDAYRKQHQIFTPIAWDPTRAAAADAYARTCNFAHTGTKGVGENREYTYISVLSMVS